jgi:hypothetical protein
MKSLKVIHTYRVNVLGSHGHIHVPNNEIIGDNERDAREQATQRARELLKSPKIKLMIKHNQYFKMYLDYQKTIHEVSKYEVNKNGEVLA